MLMQPRHHFQPFEQGEAPPSTFQFSAPDNSQPFVFTDPFTSTPVYPINMQGFAAQPQQQQLQAPPQDWMYGRMSQGSQNARKRFRPNERSFSKEGPNHLPTPSNTPTRPAFLDSSHLNNQRAMSAALQMQSAVEFDEPTYAHSGSVSSYGHDSPATPRTMNGDEQGEKMAFDLDEYSLFSDFSVPKFERTISDIYADELFQPQFTSHPMKYTPSNTSLLSPYGRSMSERLQAANNAHQSVSPQRRPSPFRQGSPYANPDYSQISAAGVRQQQKREADEVAYQQHHQPPSTSEPATISPKDAVLDYHEEDAPLYPEAYEPRYTVPNFYPPSLPTGSSDLPAYMQRSQSSTGQPPQLLSMETSASASDTESRVQKPDNTLASRGAYSCTATGCSERFESPGKLQKHRRDAHRSPPMPSPRVSEPSEDAELDRERIGSEMTSAALMERNAQTGPHRCTRVNPSTGKPCNTVFSRPYDLTRHEDTIHNGIKKKVRCHLCTEEKTFSRSDALTRHMRVVHPEVDFPGKHRRRHVS